MPAVLTLTTPTGERHYATVTALGADTVTLDGAPHPVTLPLNEVERFWDGAFVALWRTPDLAATELKAGDDQRRRVVAFQRANGLKADGVLGEDTLLVVEVVSPSSRHDDRITKPAKCATHRVPLYLLVDPTVNPLTASLYRLDGRGGYPDLDVPDLLPVGDRLALVARRPGPQLPSAMQPPPESFFCVNHEPMRGMLLCKCEKARA